MTESKERLVEAALQGLVKEWTQEGFSPLEIIGILSAATWQIHEQFYDQAKAERRKKKNV